MKQTEQGIKLIKEFFQQNLSTELRLRRVTAPLFVLQGLGINDDLNGVERAVTFPIKDLNDARAEVVHSLAKWKRLSLAEYNIESGHGIYTDMNAIRADEELDNLHSLYVDQWDWERIIDRDERNEDTLKSIVRKVYEAIKNTEVFVNSRHPEITRVLPDDITFITTQELEDRWPDKTPKEREDLAAKEYKALFLMKIGDLLKSGKKHDGRAPDYDDWELNGDIIVYYPVLDRSFEISSMGIRVDEDSLISQLEKAGCPERAKLPFQKAILDKELPYTVGGGIGQSRICMFFMRRAHIGEVQSSIWPDGVVEDAGELGVNLL